MRKWILLIFVLAFALRVVGLFWYPAGFNADEATSGYDAYSILKTGKDQWGVKFPISLRSFGDFKPALYSYLVILSVSILGLTEFAVRLPNALIGSIAVVMTYLMVKEALRTHKNVETIALFASFLLAISPWHISLSRVGFESNLSSFFMPLGIFSFYKGLTRPKWMIVSTLAFGLNLFTYHSGRFVAPLILFSLFILERNSFKRNIKKFLPAVLIFVFFLALVAFSILKGGGTRVSDVTILNPTDRWKSVADTRYEAVVAGEPDILARIFSNKAIYVGNQFIQNFLTYLSANFLFLQGASDATYGMIPGVGVLYLVELPFLIFTVILFVKNKDRNLRFFIMWILLGVLIISFSKGSGYAANRVAVIMPAIQILSSYGAVSFTYLISNLRLRKIFITSTLILLLLSLVFFLENYIYHGPKKMAPAMSYGWRDVVSYLNSIEENYDQIIISRSFSEPQIFIAFYNKWNPADYQKQSQDWLRYEKLRLPFVDQLGEYRLGKFTFRDINYQGLRLKQKTLLIGRPNEFPERVKTLKTFYYPDKSPSFLVVDLTTNNVY